MKPNFARGISVFGGAVGAILVVELVMLAVGSADEALTEAFVALGAATFALAIRDTLSSRLDSTNPEP